MSMKTKTTRRWQAVALAALVIAGSVAVPQAADAATARSVSKTCSSWSQPACTLTVKAKNEVWFRVATDSGDPRVSYTVRTAGGRLLCSGKVTTNHGNARCWFGTYTGTVKITTTKPSSVLKIFASY